MQQVKAPKTFDAMLADNMLCNVLSAAAMLTGSIGMLPSAKLKTPKISAARTQPRQRTGQRPQPRGQPTGHYPEAARKLRFSLNQTVDTSRIEKPVKP